MRRRSRMEWRHLSLGHAHSGPLNAWHTTNTLLAKEAKLQSCHSIAFKSRSWKKAGCP